jgi:hypothetical protein
MHMPSLSPEIWGPYYWFFLYTTAFQYPNKPNPVIKRKYYDLVMNLPLFIPDEGIGNDFANLLDEYPVTPYLHSRISFVKWVWFIHNKINEKLGKEPLSLLKSIDIYLKEYEKRSTLTTISTHSLFSYLQKMWEKYSTSIIFISFIIFIVSIALKHKDIYKR